MCDHFYTADDRLLAAILNSDFNESRRYKIYKKENYCVIVSTQQTIDNNCSPS